MSQSTSLDIVAIIDNVRASAGRIVHEPRFYITSLALPLRLPAPVVQAHWAIENSLHWVMDMVFRDDESQLRTNHAPANFRTIKHMAQHLFRPAPERIFLPQKRMSAGRDDEAP